MSEVIKVYTKEKMLELFGKPPDSELVCLFWNETGDSAEIVHFLDPDHVRSLFGKRKPHIRSVDDDWMA